MRRLLVLIALPALANAPQTIVPVPQEIPPAIRTMLEAAMTSGSEAEVATITKYARGAAPDAAAEIVRVANDWRAARSAEHARTLREAGFFELMRGRIELGGHRTTGNTNVTGATAIVDLTREGLRWRHKLRLLGEYQESLGVVNREHYLAAYEPNYKVDDRLYVYGAAQYESDRFFGYTDRYLASAGAGYTALRSPAFTLDLELGPSYRFTAFTDGLNTRELGARGSIDIDWRLTNGVTFQQDASAVVQNLNSSYVSTSAVAAKLFGPLSARVSYQVAYESRPPAGRVNTDTTSRASLVYSF